jgi:hypothetical protein
VPWVENTLFAEVTLNTVPARNFPAVKDKVDI